MDEELNLYLILRMSEPEYTEEDLKAINKWINEEEKTND